jgi:hypothetical protein
MGVIRNFRWWAARILPGWMRGSRINPTTRETEPGWGARLTDTIALGLDALAEAARIAAKSFWAGSAESPPDAMLYVGRESGLPRYATDTDANHKARVAARWDIWPKAGKRPTPTTGGVVEALLSYGLTNVHMVRNYDWRDQGPPGEMANWSRFWIVIKDPPWQPLTWDNFNWGDDVSWGSTATETEIRTIRSIIESHRDGANICAGIIVVFTGNIWGDIDLDWDGFDWGGEELLIPGTRLHA